MVTLEYGNGSLAHYTTDNSVIIKEVLYPRDVGDMVKLHPPGSDEIVREVQLKFLTPESITVLMECLIEVQGQLMGFEEVV